MDKETNRTSVGFDVPVLFTVFNRPESTERVFAEIRKLRPRRLFVAADGPRATKAGEAERCQKTRDVVLNNIDWDCEVKTLIREKNLGCKLEMSSAITWFFENVEEGIILEDDIIPHPSFFNYCKELLEKYRDDDRVMLIGGHNSQNGVKRGDASYYFSLYPHIWGWASWRRAWAKYDVKASLLPEFKRQKQIANIFANPAEQEFWLKNFQVVYDNALDTWDYQWLFTIISNRGLCAMPNVNLTLNIGFGEDATHTSSSPSAVYNHPLSDIGVIKHPQFLLPDHEADEFEAVHVFDIQLAPLVARYSTYRKLIKRIPQPLKDVVKKAIGKK